MRLLWLVVGAGLVLVPGCSSPTVSCPPGEHPLGVFCFPDDANRPDATALDASGDLDAPRMDAPTAEDAPAAPDAPSDDAPPAVDAAGSDAGPMCGDGIAGGTDGWCGAGTSCECCPAGGPLQRCVCTTPCTSAADCTDAARPECEIPPGTTTGFCRAATFTCCWLCG